MDDLQQLQSGSQAVPLNLEIDKLGEQQFLLYKKEHPEDEDLVPVKIVQDFELSKTVSLNLLTENALEMELLLHHFKDDAKSKLLKPCFCYVTGQTQVVLRYRLHEPTTKKLKAAFLSAISGYEPGRVEFEEKDAGSVELPNRFSIVVHDKPAFKNKSERHLPCRVSNLVQDNDDFVLLNVDLKQTAENVCTLEVTYALWNTQIELYYPNLEKKLFSTVGKIDFVPDERDDLTLIFKTPKFYYSYQYYSNKLKLLSASYGEK